MNSKPFDLQDGTTVVAGSGHSMGENAIPDDAILERYLAELEGQDAPSPEQFLEHQSVEVMGESTRRELLQTLRSVQLVHAAGKQLLPAVDGKLPTAGSSLGDFQILRPLGRGGMGVVFLARQISLDRTVALKMLFSYGMPDESLRARFQLEARAAAALHHPNIVPVFAIGNENGIDFYAMQWIKGQTLQQLMRTPSQETSAHQVVDENGPTRLNHEAKTKPDFRPALKNTLGGNPIPWRQAVQIALEIAAALSFAHRAGIVHRDIKPSNILLDETGKAWLTDFGLAHLEQSVELTAPGTVLGSLRYMSPEQLDPSQPPFDHRVDIYGLGVTLYESVTGQPATTGSSRNAVLAGLLGRRVVPPRKWLPSIPRTLETVIQTAMAVDPSDRYATMDILESDLRALLAGHPISARRQSLAVRAASWIQRNRLVSGLVTALFLGLATGLILSVLATARLTDLANARKLAIEELKKTTNSLEMSLQKSELLAEEESSARKESEQQAAKAARIEQFLLAAFRSPHPERDGKTVTIFEQAHSALHSLERDSSLEPSLRMNLLATIFEMFDGLGLVHENVPIAKQLVQLSQGTWGQDDSRTFYWREMVGNTQREAGDLESSQKTLEEALSESRRLFGDDDHQTLTILVNLSITLEQLGQKDASDKLLAEAIARSEKALNFNDEVARFSRKQLALRLAGTPRNNEAIAIWERELELEDANGRNDEESIRARLNLGTTYREARRPDKAEELLRESYEAAQRILGREHPLTGTAGNNLAWTLYDLKQLDEATRVFEAVHEIYLSTLGHRHPLTLRAKVQWAERLRERSEFPRAFELAQEAKATAESLGDQTLALAVSATDLMARLLHDRGHLHEEIRIRSEQVAMKSRLLGEAHFATLDAMNQLALAQLMSDEVHGARLIFERVAELDLANHPPNPERRRMRLRWLHLVQLQEQDFESARVSIDEWARLISESPTPLPGESTWNRIAKLDAMLGLGQYEKVIAEANQLQTESEDLTEFHLGRLQNIVGTAMSRTADTDHGLPRMIQGCQTLANRLGETADQFRWYSVAAAERIILHYRNIKDSENQSKWERELETIKSRIAECRQMNFKWVEN